MKQYASVTKDSCIACGSCSSAAPEIFDLDNDGVAEVIYEGDSNRGITAIARELLADLQDAIDSCPTGCIKLAAAPLT
ncbi:ferredoxin [Paenibacillus camerounensis]|uniref:ferredoxin n=1 Tax=Paenibacillus camerounensis TaxID=1243663 RepID=UPI0005A79D98|nr:ferredoxin [Paenibacillus camerounensis]